MQFSFFQPQPLKTNKQTTRRKFKWMLNKPIHGFCHWSLPPGLGFEAAEPPGFLLRDSVPAQGQEPKG